MVWRLRLKLRCSGMFRVLGFSGTRNLKILGLVESEEVGAKCH